MGEQFERHVDSTEDVLVYTRKEEMELLTFLFAAMSHRSRNSVKSIFGPGQVTVEDYIVTQFNYPLQPGQTVQNLQNNAAHTESNLIVLTHMHADKNALV